MSPEYLVYKWRSVLEEASPIWTWTEPHALAFCAEEASQASCAVELGTYLGASAWVMLKANPNLHLWCVDLFYEIGIQKAAEYFLRDFIKEGRCELIKGDSRRAHEMLSHMVGKIDFCFVDDGHATEDVKRDISMMLPLMRDGGILCGHDFDVPHNDVALGVIQSRIVYDVPVPRLWRHVKGQGFLPDPKPKCCGR